MEPPGLNLEFVPSLVSRTGDKKDSEQSEVKQKIPEISQNDLLIEHGDDSTFGLRKCLKGKQLLMLFWKKPWDFFHEFWNPKSSWRLGVDDVPDFKKTLPETNRKSTCKWMIGQRSFPFGFRPIFRCELLVLGRVGDFLRFQPLICRRMVWIALGGVVSFITCFLLRGTG